MAHVSGALGANDGKLGSPNYKRGLSEERAAWVCIS
jgi:hypothetical protein